MLAPQAVKDKHAVNTALVVAASAVGGAAAYAALTAWRSRGMSPKSPPAKTAKLSVEEDYARVQLMIGNSIMGAMKASQLYIGKRLKLYHTLRELSAEPTSSFTTMDVVRKTGFHKRWIREWLAQQAAMGVLTLLEGSGDDGSYEDEYTTLRFRLPKAVGEVLIDESSNEFGAAMIQLVPAMLARARDMLPEAFRTGIGRPYDDPDIAEAVDLQNRKHIRNTVMPKILPLSGITPQLTAGCRVAELGCGGGNLVLEVAAAFPNSTFDAFDVSETAIQLVTERVESHGLSGTVNILDASVPGSALGDSGAVYDVVLTHDVLHDAPFPVCCHVRL